MITLGVLKRWSGEETSLVFYSSSFTSFLIIGSAIYLISLRNADVFSYSVILCSTSFRISSLTTH